MRSISDQSTATRLKLAASALVAVPIALLLALAAGELAGGEVSGVQHIPEAAVLALLLLAGWRYPRVIGFLLIIAAVLLFAAWLVLVISSGEPEFRGPAILGWLAAGLLLFAPPAVAGRLLLEAAKRESEAGTSSGARGQARSPL